MPTMNGYGNVPSFISFVHFNPLLHVSLISFTYTPAAAAAAKSLQPCPTLCDPVDGSPPGPESLGFSRQEYWSGLPFPPPMTNSQF